MKNSNNMSSKGKKENQIMFIEYEKPTKDGHFITIVDSYHNTLGRIQKNYNNETKRYEYTAVDHQGKKIYPTNEKIWELKNQFIDNRTQLLEDAHQRRIESKTNSRTEAIENKTSVTKKGIEPEKTTANARTLPEKAGAEKISTHTQDLDDEDYFDHEPTDAELRENELENLRENGSGRSQNMDR